MIGGSGMLLLKQDVILSEAKDLFYGNAASQQDSSGKCPQNDRGCDW